MACPQRRVLLVQNEAKYLAPSNDDDGVLSVLEAFLTEED